MYITYILKSNIGHGSMPQVSEGVSFTINTASGKVENLLIGNHPVDSSKPIKLLTTGSFIGACRFLLKTNIRTTLLRLS